MMWKDQAGKHVEEHSIMFHGMYSCGHGLIAVTGHWSRQVGRVAGDEMSSEELFAQIAA
jgi:hypothetical protein